MRILRDPVANDAPRGGEPVGVSAVPGRANMPSGTVTFVFTDIEGSTQRWDRDRSAMQDALRRHDAILRAAIAGRGGHVFKTIGDAFCAAFSRPAEAISAMLEAQAALAAEDFAAVDGIRVRVAIHVGTADERDRDYFGPTVNRVARLLSIGHGGQVLLSGAVAELVAGVLPPPVTLRDLGEHRLKDLTRPERVYQLLAPALPAEFPPLRSLDQFANNLPVQMTTLIGREAEVAEINALVEAHPLVTLVGSGGIGKTRTALQVAANALDGSGDGVWFIELAPITNGEHLPTTTAAAMGIPLGDAGDPLVNLVAALASKASLLVFDNCEHLVDATARVVAALMRGCPRLKIVATSRTGLDVAGEVRYRLPSLALPDEHDAATLAAEHLTRYAALVLFVERARAADNRFALTDESAPVIATICRRLDGIALAIELAAARVRILAPRQLRDRLDERFRLLTSGRRDVLPRQQTLRALIDWSYDLLGVRERALFRRIGIFVNGFSLEGAVAVAGEERDEFEILDTLQSLIEQSLVVAEPQGDALRYRLLETTRAYAADKLAEANEERLVASRHLRYFRDRLASTFAEVECALRTPSWVNVFETDREDLRAALDAALTRNDIVVGAELLAAIERIWSFVALENEGIAYIDAFLARLPASEAVLSAKLLAIKTSLFIESGRHARGRELAAAAVAQARACGDGPTLAAALLWFSAGCTFTGDTVAALAALNEADAVPDPSARLKRTILQVRAALCTETGDFETAARTFVQLRQEARARGDERGEQVSTLACAEVEHNLGRTPEAIALVREMLPALRRGADTTLLAYALAMFAGFLAATDAFSATIEATREAIVLCAARDRESSEVAHAIGFLALATAVLGDVPRAARLWGYADATLARTGTALSFTEKNGFARLRAILADRLAPDDLGELIAQGAALGAQAAVALALERTPGSD